MRPLRDPADQALPDCDPRAPGELPPFGARGARMWWLVAMAPGMVSTSQGYLYTHPADRSRWRGHGPDPSTRLGDPAGWSNEAAS